MSQTLNEFFVHGLQDMYYAENELLDALEELAEETSHDEIAQAFRDHRDETEGHVERLERVFEMIDASPDPAVAEGIDGIIEEHESFANEDPEQHVLDIYNLAAAEKTEHYEIAGYGNLAFLATELGLDEAADLIGENLDEEQAALERLKELTEAYDYQQVPA